MDQQFCKSHVEIRQDLKELKEDVKEVNKDIKDLIDFKGRIMGGIVAISAIVTLAANYVVKHLP